MDCVIKLEDISSIFFQVTKLLFSQSTARQYNHICWKFYHIMDTKPVYLLRIWSYGLCGDTGRYKLIIILLSYQIYCSANLLLDSKKHICKNSITTWTQNHYIYWGYIMDCVVILEDISLLFFFQVTISIVRPIYCQTVKNISTKNSMQR